MADSLTALSAGPSADRREPTTAWTTVVWMVGKTVERLVSLLDYQMAGRLGSMSVVSKEAMLVETKDGR